MRLSPFVLLTLLALVAPSTSSGQAVAPDARATAIARLHDRVYSKPSVRFLADGTWHTGYRPYLTAAGDLIAASAPDAATRDTTPFDMLAEVQMWKNRAGKGAAIGAGVGAVVGAGFGMLSSAALKPIADTLATYTGGQVSGTERTTVLALAFAVPAALAGALIGAIVGSSHKGWKTIYRTAPSAAAPARVSLRLQPQRAGVAAIARIMF